ncbi:PREDICTED: inhibitor of growth protein 1-like [Acropora digitifera]|uniref:inhibitor of growth protein 1-like n=1 Tax=Acropora digitifera TaxID=70779 RepID=UPI00077A2A2E|nr:PREDICTED: inhibitor of growth protein 1-like [Acropora digitifera]
METIYTQRIQRIARRCKHSDAEKKRASVLKNFQRLCSFCHSDLRRELFGIHWCGFHFISGNRRQRNHDKHERDSEGRGGPSGATGSESVKPVKKKAKTSRKGKSKNQGSPTPEFPIDPNEPTYCLCNQVSFGEMIGCDNDECPIEWFHFQCVGLTTKPKGKWYCPKCAPPERKRERSCLR